MEEEDSVILCVCTCASSVLAIAGAYVSDAATLLLMSTSITRIPGDNSPITDKLSAVAATVG